MGRKVRKGMKFMQGGFPFTVTSAKKRTTTDIYGNKVSFQDVEARGVRGEISTDAQNVLGNLIK